MRIGRVFPLVLLAALIPVYLCAHSRLSVMNKALPEDDGVSIVLPSPILKITSLDYDGLASDFLYLKALVFFGSTYDGNKRRLLRDWEYAWLFTAFKTSTELDPYFQDPYFLANSILTWEAGRVREVNALLEKGSRYREWDYWLPFFVGFNYYYFLDDTAKAAEFMMKASTKPGADPFYGFFAARLAYKGNRTENAIVFLEGMLKTTRDETLRKDYELRLEALRTILFLEHAVAIYQQKTGEAPDNLKALVEQRIIDRIPKDPYGGRFYLDKDTTVKTTSDLRQIK